MNSKRDRDVRLCSCLFVAAVLLSISTCTTLVVSHHFTDTLYKMGGSSSKDDSDKTEDIRRRSLVEQARSLLEDELARKMMVQREVQMAVNTAKARDNIWIFGTAWATLVTGVSVAQLAGRKPPSVVGVPIVIGALVLGNMADMAYGNKLLRVTKEAEYILEHERGRFVPFKQAPFSKFYSAEERAQFFDTATAVGELFPNRYIARNGLPPPSKPEEKKGD